MIEEKINELKSNSVEIHNSKDVALQDLCKNKINTKIDLQINASIPDNYFDSDLDKINFYREVETINNLENLEELILDFKQENNVLEFPEEMQNFFNLLKVKIKA